MNQVTLQRLAVIDLNVQYARKLANGEINHYHVSGMNVLRGDDALELIKTHIEREEGPTEFTVLPYDDVQLIVDAVEVLDGERALRKKLSSVFVKSTVLERTKVLPLTPSQAVQNLAASVLNPLIQAINLYAIYPFQKWHKGVRDLPGVSYDADGMQVFPEGYDYYKYERNEILKRQIRLLQPIETFEPQRLRSIHPVSYLAFTYMEGQEELAHSKMREALKKAEPFIIGHLAMPQTMRLADTLGFSSPRVIFCFPFLDRQAVHAHLGLGEDAPDTHTTDLQIFGDCAVREGEIGPNIDSNYTRPKINHIDVVVQPPAPTPEMLEAERIQNERLAAEAAEFHKRRIEALQAQKARQAEIEAAARRAEQEQDRILTEKVEAIIAARPKPTKKKAKAPKKKAKKKKPTKKR